MGVRDSDSDLDSIRNSCDVFHRGHLIGASNNPLSLWSISSSTISHPKLTGQGGRCLRCQMSWADILFWEKESFKVSTRKKVAECRACKKSWWLNGEFQCDWSTGSFPTNLDQLDYFAPHCISSLMLPVSNVCISSAGWIHIWIFLSRALKKWTHLSCFASNWS